MRPTTRMIVFGDRNGTGGNLNEVWVLDNANGTGGPSNWTRLTPSGGPSPRAFHSAAYDSANNRMIVFGGEPSSNDVWVLSNANGLGGTPTWTKLAPTGAMLPSRRLGHTAVYDAATNRMVIFGEEMALGMTSVILDDVWVLSNANGLGGTPTWTQFAPTGDIMAREMHSGLRRGPQPHDHLRRACEFCSRA